MDAKAHICHVWTLELARLPTGDRIRTKGMHLTLAIVPTVQSPGFCESVGSWRLHVCSAPQDDGEWAVVDSGVQ